MSWETNYLGRAKTSERFVYRFGVWLAHFGMFVQRWAVRETNRREDRAWLLTNDAAPRSDPNQPTEEKA